MMFTLIPITFSLGWFSRYTVIIDQCLIVGILFIFGFTPLFSTGFSGIEGAPSFHNRDFIGPWVWAFDQLTVLSQTILLIAFMAYFLGKLCGFIYLVRKLHD